VKRRASGTIRVISVCARCGHRPDLYDVDHIAVTLGGRRHELVVGVCCRSLLPGEATQLERAAMGCDPASPIDDQEFAEIYRADAARVRRTAEHFLGAEAYAWLLPQCRELVEANRAERDRYSGAWSTAPDDDDFFGDEDDEP
jgi:hypothetical protein